MDPNALLAQLLSALDDGETDTAREDFNALCDWLDKDGFKPDCLSNLARIARESDPEIES